MKKVNSESGSTLFLIVTFLMPLMFLGFVFSIGLVKFYTELERNQEHLDSAVMLAAQNLPFQAKAAAVAQDYVTRKLGAAVATNLTITTASDAVLLELNETSFIPFASYFSDAAAIPYKLTSQARVTPTDMLLMVDSSSYLAPPAGSEWDSALPSWQASNVFDNLSLNPPTYFGLPSKVAMTQRCFNPVVSPLKKAAIDIYDYISSMQMNAVGVSFFPSDFGPALTFESRRVKRGGFEYDNAGLLVPEAKLEDYGFLDGGVLFSDANCGAAAEDPFLNTYALSNITGEYSSLSEYPSAECSPLPDFALDQETAFRFNDSREQCLNARDVIWTRGVRNTTADIDQVLWNARQQVDGSISVPGRGGLETSARRAVIIVAGDLPYKSGNRFPDVVTVNALNAGLAALDPDVTVDDPQDVQLYYVLFRQDGYGLNLGAGASTLAAEFASWPKAKLITGTDPQVLAEQLAAYLGLAERRVVISQ
ncbi:MAG: hypothetical protein H6619_00400 [Deltaproteobacteria bacterium]|nr:hypothetical protein [Deltaproteobacteria bacterium]